MQSQEVRPAMPHGSSKNTVIAGIDFVYPYPATAELTLSILSPATG